MSLNGMAESRRLWCHWRVWLKCSKTVARQSQVLPVRACCLPSRELARQSRKPKHHRPYSLSRPRAGPSSLLSCRQPPTEGARDGQGSNWTRGPRRLATSRLVEVLCARLAPWFERKGKACRKSAKPKASRARCLRLAPHPPRWSDLPREGETCCVTSTVSGPRHSAALL
jgi:hypothetical protein